MEIVMPQIMEVSKLAKLIGVIGRQKVRTDAMIQTAAVQCIAQSVEHRNSTPAAQLFDVLGKSSRRDSLVAYFERFGNLMWSKVDSKVTFCDVSKLPSRTLLAWTDEYAKSVEAVLWFNAKPEPKIKSTFDVEDAVEKLIGTIERNIKKGIEVSGTDLFDEVAAVFYAYRANLKGERIAKLAHKGATPAQLKDAGATQGQVDSLVAEVSEAEANTAPTQAEPATREKLDALQDYFGTRVVKAA
jgi:hypothetical protein